MKHIIYLVIICFLIVVAFKASVETSTFTRNLINRDIELCEAKWKRCSLQSSPVNGILYYQVLPNKD